MTGYASAISEVIDKIEKRFHLNQDAEGAELTYVLRRRIAAWQKIYDRRYKKCPHEGGGGQRGNE